MAKYTDEKEGQFDFYNTFLPSINPLLTVDDILADNNDGVLNGNILEFKLSIKDLNTVLFQTVKYLSALRIKGKPVPANIVLVDLNGEKAYLYHSLDYITDIEKVYQGGASKSNTGFSGKTYVKKYEYGSKPVDATKLIAMLKTSDWTKINIDENCIVGWATSFYKTVPNARKEDFIGDTTGKHKTIGEIRNPSIFKEYINPYTGASNVKFQYLMDKLNDDIQKKNLGAFYTPELYAEKTHTLLRKAIERVPKGNDYVIIDRCAGTGNLEKTLTDEELSHCILSTVEYYEYKVLQEILGYKVRHIIPPIEANDTFNAGLVKGADALSKEFIENPIIKQYIDNPKCTIILFENPPYAETTSLEHQRKDVSKKSSAWKQSYVVSEMRKHIKGSALNDLGNTFIWSGFQYYLRKDTDSYIVYSPCKYWKAQHIIDYKFYEGFAFNRKHFHTNIAACVTAIYWGGKKESNEKLVLEGFDIEEQKLKPVGEIELNKVHDLFSNQYYEKGTFAGATYDGILTGLNGLEADSSVKKRIKPMYSADMLGYLVADSVGFDNPDAKSSLLVAGRYNGNGCYLRKNAYLDKLPMFCASRYITYNRSWTERARIMKSADGATKYLADVSSGKLNQFLRKCLLFTCLEMQNHMRTFNGSDGRFYRNELCLDTTNGSTIASTDIKSLRMNKDEKELIAIWEQLIEEVKKTAEYDSSMTYGVYQIFAEIDLVDQDADGNNIYRNLEVHSVLQTLKKKVADYFNKYIVPVLFEYEFLK